MDDPLKKMLIVGICDFYTFFNIEIPKLLALIMNFQKFCKFNFWKASEYLLSILMFQGPEKGFFIFSDRFPILNNSIRWYTEKTSLLLKEEIFSNNSSYSKWKVELSSYCKRIILWVYSTSFFIPHEIQQIMKKYPMAKFINYEDW